MQRVLVPHVAPSLLAYFDVHDLRVLLETCKRWNGLVSRLSCVASQVYQPIPGITVTSFKRLLRLFRDTMVVSSSGQSQGGMHESWEAAVRLAVWTRSSDSFDGETRVSLSLPARNWIQASTNAGFNVVASVSTEPRLQTCVEAYVKLIYDEVLLTSEFPGLYVTGAQQAPTACLGMATLIAVTSSLLSMYPDDVDVVFASLTILKRLYELHPYNIDGTPSRNPGVSPALRLRKPVHSVPGLLLSTTDSITTPRHVSSTVYRPVYRHVIDATMRVLSRKYPDVQLHLLKFGLDLRSFINDWLTSCLVGSLRLSHTSMAWILSIVLVDGACGLMWLCGVLLERIQGTVCDAQTVDEVHTAFVDSASAALSHIMDMHVTGNTVFPLWRQDMSDALCAASGIAVPVRVTSPPFHPATVRAYHRLPLSQRTSVPTASSFPAPRSFQSQGYDEFEPDSLSGRYVSLRRDGPSDWASMNMDSILSGLPNVDGSLESKPESTIPSGHGMYRHSSFVENDAASFLSSPVLNERSWLHRSRGLSDVIPEPVRSSPHVYNVDTANFDNSEGPMGRLINETFKRFPHLQRLTNELSAGDDNAAPALKSVDLDWRAPKPDVFWHTDEASVEVKATPLMPSDLNPSSRSTFSISDGRFDITREESMDASAMLLPTSDPSITWGERLLVNRGARAACKAIGIVPPGLPPESQYTSDAMKTVAPAAELVKDAGHEHIARTASTARMLAKRGFNRRRNRSTEPMVVVSAGESSSIVLATPSVAEFASAEVAAPSELPRTESMRLRVNMSVLKSPLAVKLETKSRTPTDAAVVGTPITTEPNTPVGGHSGFVGSIAPTDSAHELFTSDYGEMYAAPDSEYTGSSNDATPVTAFVMSESPDMPTPPPPPSPPPPPPKPKIPTVKLPASFQSVLVSSGLLDAAEYELELQESEQRLIPAPPPPPRPPSPPASVVSVTIAPVAVLSPVVAVPSSVGNGFAKVVEEAMSQAKVPPPRPSRRPPPKPQSQSQSFEVTDDGIVLSPTGATMHSLPMGVLGSTQPSVKSPPKVVSVEGATGAVQVADAEPDILKSESPQPLPSGNEIAVLLATLAAEASAIATVEDAHTYTRDISMPAPTITQLVGRRSSGHDGILTQMKPGRRSSVTKGSFIPQRAITSIEDPFLHWPPPYSQSATSYLEPDDFGNCLHEPSGFVYCTHTDVYTAPVGFGDRSARQTQLQFLFDATKDVFLQWEASRHYNDSAPPVEVDPTTGYVAPSPDVADDSSDTDDTNGDW